MPFRKFFASLRGRLVVLTLVAVLPVLAVVLYDGLQERSRDGERAREDLRQLAAGAAHDHVVTIEAARQLLLLLAQVPDVRAPGAACSAFLARLWPHFPGYANMGVISPAGEVYCSALPIEGRFSAASSDWFQRALATHRFAVSGFHYGGISRRAVMTLVQPALRPAGEIAALAFVSVDLRWLAGYTERTKLPAGTSLTVVDLAGTVLARHPDPEFWAGENLAHLPLVREILGKPVADVYEGAGPDGRPGLYARLPLTIADAGLGAHLLVGIPAAAAYAGAEAGLWRNLSVLAVLTAVVLAFAWWSAEALILRRFQPLLAMTRRVAGGDLGARTGQAGGHGEIDLLAQSLDRMAETIERRERDLHASEAQLRAIIEAEPEGLQVVGPDGTLLQMNAAGLAMIEAESLAQVSGQDAFRLVVPEQRETCRAFTESVLRGERGMIELEIVGLRGTRRWLELHAVPLVMPGGLQCLLAVSRDITARKRSEAQLNYLAHYDSLTGLPNRSLFIDRLQQAMIEADRRERLVGVLFLDLDRFKNVNDSLGHEAGDQLLRSVAERLRGAVRKGDTVARLSGDEFTIVLADLAHVDDAARVAQKILDAFAQPFHVPGHDLYMTASIGITLYPLDEHDVQSLLRDADVAMYRAKESGRNVYEFYAAEMTDRASSRLALEGALRRALDSDELFLVYQPIVDCRDRRIAGAEALLRWRHPERGLVPPSEFIPLAEETGLIIPLGEWVLRRAATQLRAWQEQGLPGLRLAVNFSARQFQQRELVRNVLRILDSCGLDPRGLGLELTEGAVMRDPETSIGILRALGEAGLALSIDDFGTGYSSLSMLKRLPIDHLKIDRSFVQDVTTDPDDAALVSAIITMGRQLDIGVIAEGVETAEQLRFLRTSGCHVVQGDYFSQPLPPAEFRAWLSRHAASAAADRAARR